MKEGPQKLREGAVREAEAPGALEFRRAGTARPSADGGQCPPYKASPEMSSLSRARQRAGNLPSGAVWRSLDELSRSEGFQKAIEREFPAAMFDAKQDDWSRRNFLRLMGASMALAGIYGCSERPSEKIVPYVNPPEQVVPGMPLFFATTMPLNGFGYGVLAESHEGRPTKIEGNPDHPASLGGTNIFIQASVLQLYDPERAKDVNRAGVITSWESFANEIRDRLNAKRSTGGKGVRILTGTVTSPTLVWQLNQFLKQFPEARWHHYDPLARVNTLEGARLAFGKPLNTVYQFRRFDQEKKPVDTKIIVSLDGDFLSEEPGSLQYDRHFIAARQVRVRHWMQTTMNRLYVIESTFSITGTMADHRLPLRPSQIPAFARALAARLGVGGGSAEGASSWGKLLDAIVADLKKSENQGASLIIAGESQPPEVHALAHAMNAALGNVGKTLYYTEPVEQLPQDSQGKPTNAFDSLHQLVDDMNAGQVDTLLIFAGNPAYNAPADIKFNDALLAMSAPQKNQSYAYSNFTAHLGFYGPREDETGFRCQWHLPEAHYLESWGDLRAFDGTASIIQPLISPMRQGRTAIEVMDVLLTPPSQYRFRKGYEIVREYWQTQVHNDFEKTWNGWVQKGVIPDSQFHAVNVNANATSPASSPSTQPSGGLEIVLRRDPSVGDGSFANSGWLQECPKFLTKLVWDNAALISPVTVSMLQKGAPRDGQVVRFKSADGLSVEAPVLVVPGLPDGVVVMHFGYGMEHGGASALEPDHTPRGFNAYAIRHSRSPWSAAGVSHEITNHFHRLVVTHNHFAMDTLPRPGTARDDLRPEVVEHPGMNEEEREISNRKLIRTATLEYFNKDPADEKYRHFVRELGSEAEKKPLLSLYPGWDYSKGYQWGMSIDIQSCIGCNACLVGCVAENNIAVVGREEVAREREMHWIRIDQYFASSLSEEETKALRDGRGDADEVFRNPRVYHQPVTCMQCENAPCELVCPVGATVHSPEGINDMVYNRCVGTRYCSNNCPYKVRRFNFFNWMKNSDPSYDLQHNPQVTVRSRGVMEKCNYCIQRLSNTRIEIEKMIVRTEERLKHLADERKNAASQRQQEIDRLLPDLEREKHNKEFELLERLQVACQQACPTGAISFGHILPVETINEIGQHEAKLTQVTKLKQEPLDYPLLAELTTRPRTTYMARLRNPNPELEPEAKA